MLKGFYNILNWKLCSQVYNLQYFCNIFAQDDVACRFWGWEFEKWNVQYLLHLDTDTLLLNNGEDWGGFGKGGEGKEKRWKWGGGGQKEN